MVSTSRALLVVSVLVVTALAGCAGKDKGANAAPVADMAVEPQDEKTFTLDACKTTDPDGDVLTYSWNWVFGNSTNHDCKVQVQFPDAVVKTNAQFVASVVVRDPAGASSFAVGAITFGNGNNLLPVPAIADTPRWVKPDTEVTIDGSISKDPDGDPISYEWIWGPRGIYNEKAQPVPNACDESDTRLQTFSTGCLVEGATFEQVFDEQGTWTFHCHPHPWMTTRFVVDASLPASALTIHIRDFAYDQPLYKVGKGSKVTFINEDPAPHTATALDYTPGSNSGGKDPVFKQKFAAGEWIVRLITIDNKGARGTKTWGVKASADAPANPFARQWGNGSSPVAPGQKAYTGWYNFSFNAFVTAHLTIPNPGGAGVSDGNVSLQRVDPDLTETEQPQCPAKKDAALAGEDLTYTISCAVKADTYKFKVVALQGTTPTILPQWTVAASSTVYTKPPWGDSATCTVIHAGHCH